VKRTGRSITVASKTSQERRVIHLTLDGQPGIATRSVGSGEKRRLIVYPTGQRPNKPKNGNAENSVTEGAAHSEGHSAGVDAENRRGGRRRGRRGRGKGHNQQHHAQTQGQEPTSSNS
jgi:hypothetical protein